MRLEDLIPYATSFSLGRESDDDRRPYVVVARQYGSGLHPMKKWTVHDVSYDDGIMTSRAEFDDQIAALEYGVSRLFALRGDAIHVVVRQVRQAAGE